MSQGTAQAPERKLNLGRLERLQRLLQYGAALVLLVFVALIALAWTELRDLNARKEESKRQLGAVNAELELKKKALDAAQSVNTVLSGVADAYKEEHPDKAESVTDAVRQAAEASIARSAGPGGGQSQAASQVPPRVYIQIMRAGQRARAAEVARRLQSKGFLVPGIENMERKGHRQSYSDVRFGGGDEVASGDAANIREVLLGDFGVKLRETKLPGGTRPRQYELWLGDDFFEPGEPPRPDASPTPLPPQDRTKRVAPPTAGRSPAADRNAPDANYRRRMSP